jgi:hypothetical protein
MVNPDTGVPTTSHTKYARRRRFSGPHAESATDIYSRPTTVGPEDTASGTHQVRLEGAKSPREVYVSN